MALLATWCAGCGSVPPEPAPPSAVEEPITPAPAPQMRELTAAEKSILARLYSRTRRSRLRQISMDESSKTFSRSRARILRLNQFKKRHRRLHRHEAVSCDNQDRQWKYYRGRNSRAQQGGWRGKLGRHPKALSAKRTQSLRCEIGTVTVGPRGAAAVFAMPHRKWRNIACVVAVLGGLAWRHRPVALNPPKPS
jgi:hypothetical protein